MVFMLGVGWHGNWRQVGLIGSLFGVDMNRKVIPKVNEALFCQVCGMSLPNKVKEIVLL